MEKDNNIEKLEREMASLEIKRKVIDEKKNNYICKSDSLDTQITEKEHAIKFLRAGLKAGDYVEWDQYDWDKKSKIRGRIIGTIDWRGFLVEVIKKDGTVGKRVTGFSEESDWRKTNKDGGN